MRETSLDVAICKVICIIRIKQIHKQLKYYFVREDLYQ